LTAISDRLSLIIFLLGQTFFSGPALAGPFWGFFAHKKINELAIYTLPVPLMGFYKENREFLISESVAPDKRRYMVPGEGPKHYLDIDALLNSKDDTIPINFKTAKRKFSMDSLNEHGILPWNIDSMARNLSSAFFHNNWNKALRISANLGHYIADAAVPLHTSSNYNGQFSNQYGIHGLWESQIPEYFFDEWILITGKAEYLPDIDSAIFYLVSNSNSSVDSVLALELEAGGKFETGKYTTIQRSSQIKKTYSKEFCREYQFLMDGMVEKRMRKAIKMIGDIWYSCWVNAGQPIPTGPWKKIQSDSSQIEPSAVHFLPRPHQH
jgi:hypothetical protein